TGVDEFGVAFGSGGRDGGSRGLATIRERDGRIPTESIHQVAFADVAEATLRGELEADAFVRSSGTPAWRSGGDTLLLAARFPGSVEGDYDLASARFGAPLSNIMRNAGSR